MHTSRGRAMYTVLSCEINVNIPAKDFEMVRDGTETDKLTRTTFISLCTTKIYV
jgi:hypothetical protein